MNDEIKTKQAGNITYTLSDGDTVLTLNHPALRAPVKMGDEGFRRGDTLTEATTELVEWAVTKDGKAVRVGTRNADVLAWLRANWKVTKDWDDTMPEGVKAYRDWEEANARDREAFEHAMRRGDGRLPAKTAGEKPELTEEDEAWDSVDRARLHGTADKAIKAYMAGHITIKEAAKMVADAEERERQEAINAALNA